MKTTDLLTEQPRRAGSNGYAARVAAQRQRAGSGLSIAEARLLVRPSRNVANVGQLKDEAGYIQDYDGDELAFSETRQNTTESAYRHARSTHQSSMVLPPMAEIARRVEHRGSTSAIAHVLKAAAEAAQGPAPVPFYSIRKIATTLAVPVTTVARAYKQLQADGIIRATWGSKTVIEPRDTDRQRVFRALVALPRSTRAFATTRAHREFAYAIEDELWSSRVAARSIFYEADEPLKPDFVDTIVRHAVNAVVWFRPPCGSNAALAALSDRGVAVITVDAPGAKGCGHHHMIDRTQTLRDTLSRWTGLGVERVAVARHSDLESSALCALVDECAKSVGLRVSNSSFRATAAEFLTNLRRSSQAVIFPSSEFAATLAHGSPSPFERLLRNGPVMLLGGAIDLPVAVARYAATDVVRTEWKSVARAVTNDLLNVRR